MIRICSLSRSHMASVTARTTRFLVLVDISASFSCATRDEPGLRRFARLSLQLPGSASAMLFPVRDSIVQCRSSTAAMPAGFTRLVQKIGKRYDSGRLAGIDDNQTADRMPSHQVGSLVDGGPGSNRDDGRRHEVGDDGSSRFIPSFRTPLEVAGR